jgi:hypothetical protein
MLDPIRQKRLELEKNASVVGDIIAAGCRKAEAAAEATMVDVRERLKLVD